MSRCEKNKKKIIMILLKTWNIMGIAENNFKTFFHYNDEYIWLVLDFYSIKKKIKIVIYEAKLFFIAW